MLIWIAVSLLWVADAVSLENSQVIENVPELLRNFNDEYIYMSWLQQSADWSYSTNITSSAASAKGYVDEVFSEWMKEWKQWARSVNHTMHSTSINRALDLMAGGIVFGDSAQARLTSEIRSRIASAYNSAAVHLPGVNISGQREDELKLFMASQRDPDILKKVWTDWRLQVGTKVQPLFVKLMDLMNKAARENGYSDIGESWRAEIGMTDLVATALELWNDVADFYMELHAFVRYRLRAKLGDRYVPEHGALPVHLLGSLWGEEWDALTDILLPYSTESLPNVTSKLTSGKYSVSDLFSIAEQLYTSIGLKAMEKSFWDKSMFVEPDDGRLVDCHGAAYDFSMKNDYRIRICGGLGERDLHRAIHEMGHIEYYMAYHTQPMIFRGGANSAFHEAVGETMVYAAHSPECLRQMGLIDTVNYSSETSINILMKQALSKFVFLPWALVVDLWRYMVFSGEVAVKDMTVKWWELRKKFQGVEPPDEESSHFFDAGSKYHVAIGMPYMRYYFSRFLEHEFHEALCDETGKRRLQEPHVCCFMGSLAAGKKFRSMLSVGASQPWPDTLQKLTGQRHLSSKPLMTYYKSLYDWIKAHNQRENVTVGW